MMLLYVDTVISLIFAFLGVLSTAFWGNDCKQTAVESPQSPSVLSADIKLDLVSLGQEVMIVIIRILLVRTIVVANGAGCLFPNHYIDEADASRIGIVVASFECQRTVGRLCSSLFGELQLCQLSGCVINVVGSLSILSK
jgi:hypothetical protein